LGKGLSEILKKLFGQVVPDLYPKLQMGSRPLRGDEAEHILKAADLKALPNVFYVGVQGVGLVIKDGPKNIVNTSADPDHTGGNAAVDKLGAFIPTRELIEEGAVIIAHERVLGRMSAPTGKVSPTPVAAWPTATFFVAQKDMHVNNQPVQLLHQPAAHTDGDVMVFFRKSDVIVAGDVFDKTRYPVIDLPRGGSIQGEIAAINRLLNLMVTGEKEEGGTMVVPGHGRLCDEHEVSEYRDMLTIVRDRVADSIKKGMTLEQVKAARPSFEYDPEYGASDAFVEAVYQSLRSGSRS